jgi:hypothetical protein
MSTASTSECPKDQAQDQAFLAVELRRHPGHHDSLGIHHPAHHVTKKEQTQPRNQRLVHPNERIRAFRPESAFLFQRPHPRIGTGRRGGRARLVLTAADTASPRPRTRTSGRKSKTAAKLSILADEGIRAPTASFRLRDSEYEPGQASGTGSRWQGCPA